MLSPFTYWVNELRDATSSNLAAPEELEATVEEYAGQIAENAPLTVRACKRTVAEALKDPEQRDLAP